MKQLIILIAFMGQVRFGELPVPGASVRAMQGDKTVRTTVTDWNGNYSFPDLPEGTWTFEVVMPGFETLRREVTAGSPAEWNLKMLPIRNLKADAALPGFSSAPSSLFKFPHHRTRNPPTGS